MLAPSRLWYAGKLAVGGGPVAYNLDVSSLEHWQCGYRRSGLVRVDPMIALRFE
jgi:hypothetical protein